MVSALREIRELKIKDIIRQKSFMIRERLDKQLVVQYKEEYEIIILQAPISVYETPAGVYLVDGFHRITAAEQLEKTTISAIVTKGSVQDAHAAACLANLKHGKPLSRDERIHASKSFIKIYPKWSNVKLAYELSCDEKTVRRYRFALEANGDIEPQVARISKDGQIQPVNVNTNSKGSANAEPLSELDIYDIWLDERVLEGDALEILPTLTTKFDLIIVDPPYGITTEKWDLTNKTELLAFTRRWLNQVLLLLKPTGRLFIFWSRKYMFELKPILDELESDYPVEFGGVIVWHFRNVGAQPDNRKRFKLAWEPIFYYYGLDAEKIEYEPTEISGKKWTAEEQWDVWTHAIPQSNYNDKRIHPTQKPLALYSQIIESTTKPGDRVLDPFAGSGTTAHAALLSGRKFLLIEQSADYVKLISDRLKPVWQEGQTNE